LFVVLEIIDSLPFEINDNDIISNNSNNNNRINVQFFYVLKLGGVIGDYQLRGLTVQQQSSEAS